MLNSQKNNVTKCLCYVFQSILLALFLNFWIFACAGVLGDEVPCLSSCPNPVWWHFYFGQHASINYRKAVLGFLAQLDIAELPLFFSLLIKPLQIVPLGGDGTSDWFWTSSISSIDRFQASELLKYFSVDNITALSWKKRYGFLHVIEDVLGVFDELRIRPFLNFLVGSVVRILGSCSYSLDAAKGNISSLDESEYGSKLTSAERDNTEGNIVQVTIFTTLKERDIF